MRRFLLLTFCLFYAIGAQCQQADISVSSSIVHVATALNHLTVLEFHEPVTMAAAGSSDFQIERESNKVFVRPVKAGACTDLFVWTASQRFAYELETTEEVKKMNFALDNLQPDTPKAAPAIDADQLADVVLTRALLGAEAIASPRSKEPKKQVSVRVEQVFRTRSTVYVQYRISNNTSSTYHLASPQARQLEPSPSTISFSDLLHTQLDRPLIEKMSNSQELLLSVVHAESDSPELGPGEKAQGVVAIRRDLKSPAVIELLFEGGVKAVVVL